MSLGNSSGNDYAVETVGLVRRFGSVNAVDGIDLAVPHGEVYGFLGPNGAGKSTVVRMLTTLLLPTAGSARVAGFDVVRSADDVRLRIGAALQDAALDGKQTGRELLRLQANLYGIRGKAARRRVEELASLVDIGDALDRFIEGYSGGMKRRLDLAAALVHNPRILFLDEPTTGLDPISRSRVWEEVRRINAELGMTIFLTTQYMEEADQLAERVGIINQGRMVAEGPPGELKRSVGSDVILVTLEGDSAGAEAACLRTAGVTSVSVHGNEMAVSVVNGASVVGPVAIALNECGATVRQITLRTPTLDDVFLHYTGARMEEEAEQRGDAAPEEATA
ncbi:MAG: ATP-binding cassette domain-containing protein [Dehalococcoidia bacterium]|nr:ATP-binding cassette domain-containing protein [Dehalococcoidia bacterium]